MAHYVPPSPAQVRAGCDAVVFNDFHKRLYIDDLRIQGHEERAQEWELLYETLAAHHPPVTFSADTPAFYVQTVEVFDLRNGAPPAETVLPRAIALTGLLESDAMRFGSDSWRIVAGRYAGFIDAAQVHAGGEVVAQGWAVDTTTRQPASGVLFVIGSRVVGFDATGTVRRPDVVTALAEPRYGAGGFASCLQAEARVGEQIRVFAVGPDRTLGELEPNGGFAIVAHPGAAPASLCQSNDA
ncbi:MAG: hypothetical protein AB7E79_06770 [Rhodospirillaceae bacterium]